MGPSERMTDRSMKFSNSLHISRPVPIGQRVHRLDRNILNLLVHAAGKLLHKVAHQQRYVLVPLPQRLACESGKHAADNRDRCGIPGWTRICARSRLVAASRRMSHLDGARAAQAFEFLVLQYPQQLGLQFQRDVARLRPGTSVPPSASSTRPTFWRIAPVNAPFSCPNNSLSSSPVGMAAQFNLIKLPFRRELRR